MVHGIMKSHGGAVSVESAVGKGTAFSLFFPRLESGAADEPQKNGAIPRGNGRVLWVDDEETLAELGKQMLEFLGYEAVIRTSSREALEAFRAQPSRFDLVVTDQTMPQMTGAELAGELLRIRPDLPIILCTGFSEALTPEKAGALGIREFLLKPVVLKDLADAMQRALACG